jgi:hypothetical protein
LFDQGRRQSTDWRFRFPRQNDGAKRSKLSCTFSLISTTRLPSQLDEVEPESAVPMARTNTIIVSGTNADICRITAAAKTIVYDQLETRRDRQRCAHVISNATKPSVP